MKRLSIYLMSIMFIGLSLSCEEDQKNKEKQTVNVTTVVNPADGLDLKLVGTLLQGNSVKNASDLEKSLNKEGGINNLDLDKDGKIDFINVAENKSTSPNIKSFDLTTGKSDDLTYIATIEVEKGKENFNINLSGSENLYGNDRHYSSNHGISGTDMLLMYWMFNSRPMYSHTPYYAGSYPTYYSNPRTVNNDTYQSRTSDQRAVASKTVKKQKSYTPKVKSNNVGKVSKSTRTSLDNHNKAKKSFKERSSKKTTKKKGFTKTKPTTTKKTTKAKTKPKTRTRSRSRSRSRSSSRRGSDGKYKVSVNDLESSLNKVMELNSVTYYWDPTVINDESFKDFVGEDLTENKMTGFIAQDIENVFPNLVDNSDPFGKKVDYEMLVPYLVKAIQEQQEMILKQQEQINQLNIK